MIYRDIERLALLPGQKVQAYLFAIALNLDTAEPYRVGHPVNAVITAHFKPVIGIGFYPLRVYIVFIVAVIIFHAY